MQLIEYGGFGVFTQSQHRQRNTTPAKIGRRKYERDRFMIKATIFPDLNESYLKDEGHGCVRYDNHGQRHAPVLRNAHDLRTGGSQITHTHTDTHTHTHRHTHTHTFIFNFREFN